MLKILNRDYEQTWGEIMQEFPDCFFLAIVQPDRRGVGKLVGVSEEPETLQALGNYRENFSESVCFCMGGSYGETIGVRL